MKVLLKKEICSSYEQCTGPTRQATTATESDSQKKKKNADAG